MIILKGCLLLLSVSMIFGTAFYFYKINQYRKALVFNMFGGVILRGWCASDRFLNEWDERFHALVAKNLMTHPLRPTLYETPILPFDFTDWANNHIWLSKQPLPLWAMAGSMQVFGINEIALRIPSVLIGTVAIFLTYEITKLLFHSPKVALLAAFLHAIHGLVIEINGGRDSSDHVMTFFSFFIELGLYMSLLSARSPRKIFYSCLTGVCIGLAFLCKWHPCLLVLPIWATAQMKIRDIFQGLLPLIIAALLVAVPWQIYLFKTYPIETRWMYGAVFHPMKEAIQGHSGAWWYYLDQIRMTFGEIIYLPMLWLAIVVYKKMKKQNIRFLGIWLFLPIFIYSLMATKRQTYLVEFAPAFFVLTALFFYFMKLNLSRCHHRIPQKLIQFILILLIILPIRYSIERIKPFDAKEKQTKEQQILRGWQKQIDGSKAIIFKTHHRIEAMFYLSCVAAYEFLPDMAQVEALQKRGFIVCLVNSPNLPEAFREIHNVKILEFLK